MWVQWVSVGWQSMWVLLVKWAVKCVGEMGGKIMWVQWVNVGG